MVSRWYVSIHDVVKHEPDDSHGGAQECFAAVLILRYDPQEMEDRFDIGCQQWS